MSNPTLSVTISSQNSGELQDAISAAFDNIGVTVPTDAFTFEGPPPGSFGYGEGVLEFVADAWKQLIKVPNAIETLATGLADFMRKKRINIVFKVRKENGEETELALSGNITAEEIEALTLLLATQSETV